MSGQLYERWLTEGAGATLSEFVASERGRLRQDRAWRWWAQHHGPLLQQMQAPASYVLQQQALQNAPAGMYRGAALGGIGNLFSWLGRP